MKSIEELMAFCEGYALGLRNDREFYGNDLSNLDDWVTWGGYYINLFGSYYGVRLNDDTQALAVDAYKDKEDMTTLDDPIYSFNRSEEHTSELQSH